MDALDKSDIAEVRVFSKPPELVGTVMEAICILFNVHPDWASAKTVLRDPSLMKKMIDYDKVGGKEMGGKVMKKEREREERGRGGRGGWESDGHDCQSYWSAQGGLHCSDVTEPNICIHSSYRQDDIPNSTLKKLKKYTENSRFVPEVVEKTSKACKSIYLWVRTLDLYSKVYRTVEPKREW